VVVVMVARGVASGGGKGSGEGGGKDNGKGGGGGGGEGGGIGPLLYLVPCSPPRLSPPRGWRERTDASCGPPRATLLLTLSSSMPLIAAATDNCRRPPPL
jgi:hypothetical protein